MKRPGYYVEGKFFRDNIHQARARAAFLAGTYGRGIELLQVDVDGATRTVSTVFNGKPRRAAA